MIICKRILVNQQQRTLMVPYLSSRLYNSNTNDGTAPTTTKDERRPTAPPKDRGDKEAMAAYYNPWTYQKKEDRKESFSSYRKNVVQYQNLTWEERRAQTATRVQWPDFSKNPNWVKSDKFPLEMQGGASSTSRSDRMRQAEKINDREAIRQARSSTYDKSDLERAEDYFGKEQGGDRVETLKQRLNRDEEVLTDAKSSVRSDFIGSDQDKELREKRDVNNLNRPTTDRITTE